MNTKRNWLFNNELMTKKNNGAVKTDYDFKRKVYCSLR